MLDETTYTFVLQQKEATVTQTCTCSSFKSQHCQMAQLSILKHGEGGVGVGTGQRQQVWHIGSTDESSCQSKHRPWLGRNLVTTDAKASIQPIKPKRPA